MSPRSLLRGCLLIVLSSAMFALLPVSGVAAAKSKHGGFPVNFRGSLTGSTIYFAPAGMEPDFDIVNRVIISTQIHKRGLPPVRLILDAYLENFQSDTQPVLPDLIHPNIALSTTLGGFFSGEALIVAPGNRIIYTGSILAEALINPYCLALPPNTQHPPKYCLSETQHMAVYLVGQGPAKGSTINTRSWFVGNQKLQVTSGKIYGLAHIPKKARRALASGTGSLTTKQVLSDFKVTFPRQRGLNAGSSQTGPTGTQCWSQHCINPTQKAPGSGTRTNLGTDTRGSIQPGGGIRWSMVIGFCLIGLAVILLAVYFWQGRREKQARAAHAR